MNEPPFNDIDYSSLDTPLRKVSTQVPRDIIIILSVVITATIGYVLWIALTNPSARHDIILFGIIFIAIILLAASAALPLMRLEARHLAVKKKARQFSKDNGFTYRNNVKTKGKFSSLLTEGLFEIKISGKITDQERFYIGTFQADFQKKELGVRDGLHCGVMRIDLPTSLSHIIIDSGSDDTLSNFIDTTLKLKKIPASRTHNLEGDFYKFFRVYCEPAQIQEMYKIITPDIMSLLVELGKGYSYEIIGNKLFIYEEFTLHSGVKMLGKDDIDFSDPIKMRALFTAMSKLYLKLSRKKI